MGRIREQVKHASGAELMVVERESQECREPWHFVHLEFDGHGEYMSPKQLRELGRWLVAEGKRLGKQYKSNGAPKGTDAMSLKKLNVAKVAHAIEADAGQALPGLREALAEAKAGHFAEVHTREQIATRRRGPPASPRPSPKSR